MPDYSQIQVTKDHRVPVGLAGESVVVTNVAGDVLYYGDRQVTSTSNQGSLTAGQSVTVTIPQNWLISAGLSSVLLVSTTTAGGGTAVGGGVPVAFQLVSPSGADDTANIKAAVAAAVTAGQANGTNYAEVWFDSSKGPFVLSGALDHTQGGNAQVPLPNITSGSSTPKFTLRLAGVPGVISLPHWNQTVGQKTGAVLRTTITGTNDVTWGPACVVGGPNTIQGFGGGSGNAWSNMNVILDGVQVSSASANPTMSGFDFSGCLEAKIVSGSYIVDATPTVMNGFITTPANFTNQWTFGLHMPVTNNNDLCIVQDWSAEGVWYPIILGEHSHVHDLRSVYCGWGISLDNTVGTPHTGRIEHASVEVCIDIMGLQGSPGGIFKLDIDLLDIESSGHIWDGNSLIQGTIGISQNVTPAKGNAVGNVIANYVGNWNASPTNGSQMRLICRDVLAGAVGTPPAVPAASTDAWNLFMCDAAVMVAGGTGVAISVDGVSTGLASGTVMVPAGKKYNLGAYSVAPTFKWVLL